MKNALFSYHTFMVRHQLLPNTEKSNFFQLVSHTKQYKDCGGTRHYYFNIPGCSFFLRCADSTFPLLEIVINPIRLLGSDSHTKIFDPSTFSFCHVENKMNELLQSLDFPYQFRDFTLARLDLCVNLQMKDRNLLPSEEDEPNLLRFELALESKSIQNLQREYGIDDTAEFLYAIHLNGICEKYGIYGFSLPFF